VSAAGCFDIKADSFTLDPRSFARTQRLPLSYHPLSNSVILPSSHPSSLQIYSPSTSRLLSELEVSPSNRISRRDDDPLEFARVELVRVDPSGRWMATIDTRSGETGRSGKPEVYLKIWEWAAEGEEWKLAARFDDPHTEGDIKEMLFRPKKKAGAAELVSSGGDGSVKVWKVVSSKTGGAFPYFRLGGY
jgi:NET1-associated nuclear protein 1 (U3 small nucleolar RNA-associated protein 17)